MVEGTKITVNGRTPGQKVQLELRKARLQGNMQILRLAAQNISGDFLAMLVGGFRFTEAEVEYMLRWDAGVKWRERGVPYLDAIWDAYYKTKL